MLEAMCTDAAACTILAQLTINESGRESAISLAPVLLSRPSHNAMILG